MAGRGLSSVPCGALALQAFALFVKRTSEHAVLPVRGSAGAAGYDLSRYVVIVYP